MGTLFPPTSPPISSPRGACTDDLPRFDEKDTIAGEGAGALCNSFKVGGGEVANISEGDEILRRLEEDQTTSVDCVNV